MIVGWTLFSSLFNQSIMLCPIMLCIMCIITSCIITMVGTASHGGVVIMYVSFNTLTKASTYTIKLCAKHTCIMTNVVKLEDHRQWSTIQQLALVGFLLGKDNYGEQVVGISDEFSYSKMMGGYSITVHLREKENHSSTSGIGFYVKQGGKYLQVFSNGEVMVVGITPDIQRCLDSAIIEEY